MRLGQDVLSDLPRALAREWLLADGLGGAAYGTAAGAHTRRAHALLTVPHGRATIALLKLDERLLAPDGPFDLAVNLLAGDVVRPAGHLLLEEFRLDPGPVWRYRAGGVVLEKSLLAIPGHRAISLTWRHLDGPAARLTLSPLVVARGHTGGPMRGIAQGLPGRVRIETVAEGPALTLWHNGALLPARAWLQGLVHPADDLEPDATEDAFVPGHLEGALAPGSAFHVVASTEEDLFRALAVEGRLGTPAPRTLAACVTALEASARAAAVAAERTTLAGADYTARQAAAAHGGPGATIARRREPLLEAGDAWTLRLTGALELGLVRRGTRLTVIESLPSGEERCGAALRSVPALIALRRFDEAGEILRGLVDYLDDGLAPERFDAVDGRPVYGGPAPALWMVHAAELLARRSEDVDRVRDAVYPMLEGVMQYFRAGTRGGVRVDAEGLLAIGEGDAIERRCGLNVLWYHALVAMSQLARLVGRKESGAFYLAWAREHQKAFNDRFWDEARGCMHARLDAQGARGGLDPEQLFAVSLAPALLPPDRAAQLVATVERELFTPWGLRLAPGAPRVEPAWLGPFHTTYLRAHGRSAEAQARVVERLETLRATLDEQGSGTPPAGFVLDATGARPTGDPASTLAAAELLRLWIEEVDHTVEPVAVA